MARGSMEVRTWSWTALALLGAAGLAHGQTWSMLPPPEARSGHVMAYDSARGCTVLFGGAVNNATMARYTWEFWGNRWVHVQTTLSPPYRQLTAMVYDSRRGRIVLFGGTNTTRLNDTWEYDGTNWTRISTATSPPARSLHSMTYDPTIGAVVLFGGQSNAWLADTWIYDGTDWIEISPLISPSARFGAALTFDPAIGRSVLFGGSRAVRLSDTWEFDGTTLTWGAVSPSVSPPARMYHAMAYVPTQGCTLLGGWGNAPLGDTWTYVPTRSTWMQIQPPNSPPARYRHAMVYDPSLGCVMFGGAVPANSDETWILAGGTWTIIPAATMPPLRVGPTLCFDNRSELLLMFGGHGAAPSRQLFDDTWELDGQVWRRILTPTSLIGRWYRAGAYDQRRARAVAFGGAFATSSVWTFFNDTWEFDGLDWVQRTPTASPSPRCGHLAYDSWRGVTVMFGGWDVDPATRAFRALAETWLYDGTTWTPVPTRNAPSPRFAQLAFDASRGVVVLFGGARFAQGLESPIALAETWEFDGSNWQLITTNPASTPSARYWNGLTYDPSRGRVLMFGGITTTGGFGVLDETWEYDGAARTWTLLPTPHGPSARGAAGMAYDPVHDRTVAVYGTDLSWDPIGGVMEFQPAKVPAFSRYGSGCVGSNGTPSLDVVPGSLPALGGALLLDLSQLPPAGGTLLLGAGLGIGQSAGMPLPLDLGFAGMPRCDLWIGLDPALSIQHGFAGGGTHRISIPIPNVAALGGLQLALQALVLDSGSPNGVASMSNAAIATIH